MRHTVTLLLISWTFVWASTPTPAPRDPYIAPWLVASLVAAGVMLWGMYRALVTKNPKYGYLILVMGLLMVGLLFL